MSRHTRRDFLKSAAAAGLATSFTVAGTRASAAVLGANDRLRIGVCGLNGRGQSHAGSYNGMSDAEVAYVIEPDEPGVALHLGWGIKRYRGDRACNRCEFRPWR